MFVFSYSFILVLPSSLSYIFSFTLVVPKVKFFCAKGKFTCRDLSCISIVHRCDGHADCPHDRSDEEGCRMFVFLFFYFYKKKKQQEQIIEYSSIFLVH